VGVGARAMIGFCCRQGLPTTTIVDNSYLRWPNVGHHKLLVIYDGVIPCSEKEGTKPPYVCLGCSNHTYSNNMITRIHV
jgi:hypothetical protein